MDNARPNVIKHLASFQLTTGCLLHFGVGSLTWFEGDAIVNAANEFMLGGFAGVDAAVHQAAGPDLRGACAALPAKSGVRCPTGEARRTPGFKLLAKHVIHAVGPVYSSDAESAPLLASAYRSALAIANSQKRIRTVAFPAISCGAHGYPPAAAAAVALRACAGGAGTLSEITFVFLDAADAQPFLRCARTTLSPFPPSAALAAAAGQRSLLQLVSWRSGRACIDQHACFHLGGGCVLYLGIGDITCFSGDAVVNCANEALSMVGGLCCALERTAGGHLREACEQLPLRAGVRCPAGQARMTPGFGLPAAHVIHAVAPQYEREATSAPVLASAYRNALALAGKPGNGIRNVAFPALGSGRRGYPLWDVAAIALDECAMYAAEAHHDLESVTFVFQDEDSAQPFFFQAASMFSRMQSLPRELSTEPRTGGDSLGGRGGSAGWTALQGSPGASVKARHRGRGEDAEEGGGGMDSLHVLSAVDSARFADPDGVGGSTEGSGPPGGLAAAEARHGCLFNQATQMDTFADSGAFATLPLPAPGPPQDPGSNAPVRQRLDHIQDQLAAFGPHGMVLKRFELLDARRRGGQAVVQFVRAPQTNAQYAMKLFAGRAAYNAERSLFATDDLRDFMPPVVEFVDNEDGAFRDPFGNPMPPCFVMERGEALQERTARCAHDFFTIIQIVGQVAECLTDLHARGWVHRDLKPGNIIFLPSRGAWTLIDFGLAARAGCAAPDGHTPGYAPPEIIAAHDRGVPPPPADPATDAWALAVMAFELLTGHPAFDWMTGSQQAYTQLRGDAPLPWEGERLTDAVRAKLGVLRSPILETLNRDPAARPPCSVFCDRLRAAFSADSSSLRHS